MRIRGWLGWGLLLVGFAAFAGVGSVRKQIEASVLVTGTIVVDREGKTQSLTLDHEDKLPREAVAVVRDAAARWRFEPVLIDGRPVVAQTGMSVRVVAKQLPDDRYGIRIGGVAFGTEAAKPEATVRSGTLAPPRYPRYAGEAAARGTVYVVVKVGRDGTVEDAVVEQVNLRVITTEGQMAKLRRIFADSALRAALKWTFIPPTEGEEAGEEFWLMRVPVKYSFEGDEEPSVYAWQSYIPGPVQTIPWETGEAESGFSPDAVPEGSVYLAGSGPKLLTPPEG